MNMPKTIHLGIISDDKNELHLISDLLNRQGDPLFKLGVIETDQAAAGLFGEHNYQALLIDYRIGEHPLFEIIHHGLIQNIAIPLILLTDHEEPGLNQLAIDSGIDELLPKDHLTPELLARTIQHGVARKKIERELLKSENRYRRTAELAAGVIHNIRNVLSGIEIGCDAILTTIRGSKLPGVPKLAQLLAEHETRLGDLLDSAEKGRLIPKYTRGLGYELQAEHDKIREEVKELHKQLGSIKELIDTHQAEAKLGVQQEEVFLEDAIRDVLKLTSPDLLRNRILISKNIDQTAHSVYFNPSILRHILINIVKNAIEAMADADTDRRITFTSRSGSNQNVILEISDTGPGIAREYRNRIFLYGFTTKQTGHGLGLHYCRGAMRESGGDLRVRGNEPSAGAAFILIFP